MRLGAKWGCIKLGVIGLKVDMGDTKNVIPQPSSPSASEHIISPLGK
jgi:hypothetical protein